MASPPTLHRTKMLTEFQLRIARIVLRESPDPDLALAGGAALIHLQLVERTTMDLDFFTTAARVAQLVETLEPVLEEAGMAVRREQVTPSFARLIVAEGRDECRVDVAQDFRLLPAVPTALGPMLASEELAADKTLTLFTRAEARDYVDVFFLERRFGKDRLCELAKEKDPGFDRAAFAEMLGAIDRLDRNEFDVDDATFNELREFFASWLGVLR